MEYIFGTLVISHFLGLFFPPPDSERSTGSNQIALMDSIRPPHAVDRSVSAFPSTCFLFLYER